MRRSGGRRQSALALLLLLFLAFQRGVDVRATGAALAAASIVLLGASWMLAGRLVLLPVLTPLGRGLDLLRLRRRCRSTCASAAQREAAVAEFSRFVNPHVVKQLLEQGGIKTERRDVTLLFSDIRGFTTLSETRSPEEVVDADQPLLHAAGRGGVPPRRHARQVHRRLHHGDLGRAARRRPSTPGTRWPARSTWPTRCRRSSASSAPSTSSSTSASACTPARRWSA